MKYARTFGLAAIAVVAAMAFVGVSSASATTLCSTKTNPCTGTTYGVGQEIIAHSPKAELKGTITVTCESDASGKVTALGTPIVGSLVNLSFTNCSGCSKAETLNLPYKAEISASGANDGNGTFKASSGGKGAPGAKLTGCTGFNLECVFSVTGGTASLSANGGAPGTLVAKEVPLTRTGGSALCGSSATWTATYTINTPSSIFVF